MYDSWEPPEKLLGCGFARHCASCDGVGRTGCQIRAAEDAWATLHSFFILQQKIEEGLNFCRILIVFSNGELFQLLLRVFKRKIGEKVSDSDAQTMADFLNRRNALSI